jgi:hypothetical protein
MKGFEPGSEQARAAGRKGVRASYPTRKRSPTARQLCTRVPIFWPGDWIRLKQFSGPGAAELSGKVLQVRSLTCSITHPEQQLAVWRVHLEGGRCVEVHMIEHYASEAEIAAAKAAKQR